MARFNLSKSDAAILDLEQHPTTPKHVASVIDLVDRLLADCKSIPFARAKAGPKDTKNIMSSASAVGSCFFGQGLTAIAGVLPDHRGVLTIWIETASGTDIDIVYAYTDEELHAMRLAWWLYATVVNATVEKEPKAATAKPTKSAKPEEKTATAKPAGKKPAAAKSAQKPTTKSKDAAIQPTPAKPNKATAKTLNPTPAKPASKPAPAKPKK